MSSVDCVKTVLFWPTMASVRFDFYSKAMKLSFIYLHISIFLAGFTGVFGRLITMNEALLVWYRVMFASGFFLIYFAVTKTRFVLPIKDILRIGWVGALLALHWILFYASIKYSNVSIGVVTFASLCFWTAIIDPIMSRRAFSIKEILFSLLTIVGIALIFHFDTRYQVGIILGILSAIACSVLSIETRRVSFHYPLMTFLFYEILTCFFVMSLIVPIYLQFFEVDSIVPSPLNFTYLCLMASFCTVGMFIFQVKAFQALSTFTVNLSYNLEPVYSIVIAMILFSEAKEVNFSFYAGLLLICASVALQSWSHWKDHQKTKALKVAQEAK